VKDINENVPCISDFYIHYYIITPTLCKTMSGVFNVYHETLKIDF